MLAQLINRNKRILDICPLILKSAPVNKHEQKEINRINISERISLPKTSRMRRIKYDGQQLIESGIRVESFNAHRRSAATPSPNHSNFIFIDEMRYGSYHNKRAQLKEVPIRKPIHSIGVDIMKKKTKVAPQETNEAQQPKQQLFIKSVTIRNEISSNTLKIIRKNKIKQLAQLRAQKNVMRTKISPQKTRAQKREQRRRLLQNRTAMMVSRNGPECKPWSPLNKDRSNRINIDIFQDQF